MRNISLKNVCEMCEDVSDAVWLSASVRHGDGCTTFQGRVRVCCETLPEICKLAADGTARYGYAGSNAQAPLRSARRDARDETDRDITTDDEGQKAAPIRARPEQVAEDRSHFSVSMQSYSCVTLNGQTIAACIYKKLAAFVYTQFVIISWVTLGIDVYGLPLYYNVVP